MAERLLADLYDYDDGIDRMKEQEQNDAGVRIK